MQLSVAAGSSEIAILLQPEIFNSPTGVVDGNYIFADSENTTLSIRPKLTIEYRVTEQWLAPAPTQVAPSNYDTLWNTSSYELVGPDSIAFEFNSQTTNVTNWQICHGQEIRWLDCESSTDSASLFGYDSATNTFNLDDPATLQSYYGDQWQYWRIRGDQDPGLDTTLRYSIIECQTPKHMMMDSKLSTKSFQRFLIRGYGTVASSYGWNY